MDVGALLRAPLTATRLTLRALDDLNALADRARRDPDPVEEVRERVDTLIEEIRALVAVAGDVLLEARAITGVGGDVVERADALLIETRRLDGTGGEIVIGGQDLVHAARCLEVETRELIDGGQELTATSMRIDDALSVFRTALPRLLDGLDTVEELEGAVETVAETVEPLQGA